MLTYYTYVCKKCNQVYYGPKGETICIYCRSKDDMITIKKAEYDRLIERDAWLNYLEAAGVDNWEGYDFACEARRIDEAKDNE